MLFVMHVHFYKHFVADPAVVRELERLNRTLEKFMSDIDDFVAATLAKIAAQKTQIDSISQLLTSIKHELADALQGESLSSGAKAKLSAIFPSLEANTGEISDAITANTDTPVAPPVSAPVVDQAPTTASDPAPSPALAPASTPDPAVTPAT